MRRLVLATVLYSSAAFGKPVTTGVIARDEPQFATRAEAAKATAATGSDDLMSVRIVAEHGDVVEVSTAYTPDDCVSPPDTGYSLTVFVPRAALVPRVAKPIVKTFADGTGYAVRAGAPARVHGATVDLVDPMLRATGAKLASTDVAASMVVTPPTPLPTVGDRLVCDPDLQRLDAWQKKLADTAAKKAEAERAACEARRAAAPKPAKAKSKGQSEIDVERFTAALAGDSCGAQMGAMLIGAVPPPCLFSAPAKLELDGKATVAVSAGGGGAVYRRDTHTFVTLATQCGEIRASTDPKLLGRPGNGGMSAIGGGTARWWPRPFTKVYWPNGKPAGSYDGHVSYADGEVEQRKDMICVAVRGVQTKICHRRKDIDHR